MKMKIRQIALDRLVPHPDNANRMSRAAFGKLMHHIKQTGCYEPLVVRRHPQQRGCFQIVHGHHRFEALRRLGYESAQAIVWNIDDEQTDVLLSTLNRLTGRDLLDRKLTILRRLCARRPLRELAKLLPQTKGQLERLTAARPLSGATRRKVYAFAVPMVFFVNENQQATIESALASAIAESSEATKAARRASALTQIASCFAGSEQERPDR